MGICQLRVECFICMRSMNVMICIYIEANLVARLFRVGLFEDVRLAALECLVDFVRGIKGYCDVAGYYVAVHVLSTIVE